MSDRALLEELLEYVLSDNYKNLFDHFLDVRKKAKEIRTRMTESHSNPYRDILLGLMASLRMSLDANRTYTLKELKQILYNYELWDENIQKGKEHFTEEREEKKDGI
jgi:hypothetical protein